MSKQKHISKLREGSLSWNKWRGSWWNFSKPLLQKADLSGADLRDFNLHRADLEGANLRGANLRGANLREADLSNTNLRGANLSRANLSEANLNGANLEEANLNETNLSRSVLHGASLQKANLEAVNLNGVDLRGTDIQTIKEPQMETCSSCGGSGKIEVADPDNPPSYNYGNNGPDYTDPSTGWPMGYTPKITDCYRCNGNGLIIETIKISYVISSQ